MSVERRQCPECLRPWPRNDPRLKLAGFGWLEDLPRHISPNNVDCLLHDGYMGRNRFLALETKRPDELLLDGQARALMGLARLEPFTVRVLRGTAANFTVLRVSADGIATKGPQTSGASLRAAIASWLNGALWRDAEAGLDEVPVALATVVACATCGASPSGNYSDGSPRFGCGPHEPFYATAAGAEDLF